MALTITENSFDYTVFGNKSVVIADIAISGTYSEGGDVLPFETLFGLHTVDMVLAAPKDGFNFEYDGDNAKLKMFNPRAPLIAYDEHHVLDSDYQLTTDYPPAFFIQAAQHDQNLKFRSTGLTLTGLGDSQICLSAQMAAGARTTLLVDPTDALGGEGAFTGAATNWTPAAGWTYATNDVDKDGDGVGTLAHDNFAAVIGRTYRLTYTISSWTVGTVTPTLGGVAGTAAGADGTYTEDFVATTTGGIIFTPTNTARFTIDDVTIDPLDVFATYVTQAWKDVWDNLVQDETKTLATGANTLTSGNKIAALMYMDQTTATAAALTPVDEDDTVASGELEVAFGVTTGQLTAHADQNAKAIKITYIKVPSSGFLKDRFFHNETATGAGSDPYTSTFNYPILLWGYTGFVPINTGATQVLIDQAGTPAAGEAVIDFFNPGTRGAGAPATGTVIGTKSNVTATGAGIWGVINEVPGAIPLEMKNGESVSISSMKIIVIGT